MSLTVEASSVPGETFASRECLTIPVFVYGAIPGFISAQIDNDLATEWSVTVTSVIQSLGLKTGVQRFIDSVKENQDLCLCDQRKREIFFLKFSSKF